MFLRKTLNMMSGSEDPARPGPCASEFSAPARTIQLPEPNSLPDALKHMIDIQGERALTYTLFDDGYQEYIQSGPEYDFALYRNLVHHVTMIFKDLSDQANKLEAQISGPFNRGDLGQLVRRMQELEKDKLQLTAEYHMAGQRFMDNDDQDDTEISELKKRIGEIAVEVSDIMDQFKDETE